MADWRIEPLDRSHDRQGFSCGVPALDEFLTTLVHQYEKRQLGRTYVAVRPQETRVLGYYTLAASSISFENLPVPASRKLPRHPVPVILLARLAVHRAAQGQGLGEALLLDALRRSLDISRSLGVHGVEVHAIDDSAISFYEKYGFVALGDARRHLFLPMETIRKALGPEQAS